MHAVGGRPEMCSVRRDRLPSDAPMQSFRRGVHVGAGRSVLLTDPVLALRGRPDYLLRRGSRDNDVQRQGRARPKLLGQVVSSQATAHYDCPVIVLLHPRSI
jgi:hypothetical protein